MVRTVTFDEFLSRRAEMLDAAQHGDIRIQRDGKTIAYMISGDEYLRLQGHLGRDAAAALEEFRAAALPAPERAFDRKAS